MKVLLTGASGFLGGYIYEKIRHEHIVITVGRSESNQIQHDLCKGQFDEFEVDADMVIHVAGKAHIYPKTEMEKRSFYEVNTDGTQHLLNSLKKVKQFVFISTVSVYGLETGFDIDENFPTVGNSPYADSKIKAEKLVSEWGRKKNVRILILRLPLIVGKNPPGNLGKMISAINKKRYLSIDGGNARKSGVLASDVADLIYNSFEKEGVYNLTDRCHPSFREYEAVISKQLNKPMPRKIPISLARMIGYAGDIIPGIPVNSDTVKKITQDLIINDDKAVKELNWAPNKIIDHFKIM